MIYDILRAFSTFGEDEDFGSGEAGKNFAVDETRDIEIGLYAKKFVKAVSRKEGFLMMRVEDEESVYRTFTISTCATKIRQVLRALIESDDIHGEARLMPNALQHFSNTHTWQTTFTQLVRLAIIDSGRLQKAAISMDEITGKRRDVLFHFSRCQPLIFFPCEFVSMR